MTRAWAGLTGWLLLAFGCGSSSAEVPIDPVAAEYCAACSEELSCEPVVDRTISAVCTDETRAWYACMTENACNDADCDAQWNEREVCMDNPPAELLER